MTIKTWVKLKGGPRKVAKEFKVTTRNVYQWCASESLPRPELMQKIYRMSRGKVGYNSMISSYVSGGK